MSFNCAKQTLNCKITYRTVIYFELVSSCALPFYLFTAFYMFYRYLVLLKYLCRTMQMETLQNETLQNEFGMFVNLLRIAPSVAERDGYIV